MAMSRAQERTTVYVVADDLNQALIDLASEWRTERRQHWVFDTDMPAGVGGRRRPSLGRHADNAIRRLDFRANAMLSRP